MPPVVSTAPDAPELRLLTARFRALAGSSALLEEAIADAPLGGIQAMGCVELAVFAWAHARGPFGLAGPGGTSSHLKSIPTLASDVSASSSERSRAETFFRATQALQASSTVTCFPLSVCSEKTRTSADFSSAFFDSRPATSRPFLSTAASALHPSP